MRKDCETLCKPDREAFDHNGQPLPREARLPDGKTPDAETHDTMLMMTWVLAGGVVIIGLVGGVLWICVQYLFTGGS